MSSTKYKSSDPRMFTVPATDCLRDALIGSEVHVETNIRMTPQRGVFEFTSCLYNNTSADLTKPFARLVELYPNMNAATWDAFWFRHTTKIARMADDYHTDQGKARATKQGGRG